MLEWKSTQNVFDFRTSLVSTAAPYREDIDGLRALAVLPVLLFHFHVPGFSGGFAGVDVFFVISGFVIARSILLDIEAGRFTIAQFYFKRVRRILPALLFVMTLTTIAAIILLLPTDLTSYGKSLSASAFFIANFYFWKSSSYFAPEATTNPLLHLWSLSVEEQYYIIAPVAFLVIYRYLGGRWLTILAPALVLSFLASIAGAVLAPTANFFLLPSRAWELLAGALLFIASRKFQTSSWKSEILAACGAILLFGSYIFLNEDMPFPGWTALPPVLGSVLVILSGVGSAGRLPVFNRWLSWRPLVLVGLVSYSLYLVHWPIVSLFTYQTMRAPSLPEAAVMVVASFVLAAFSWRYVEQPWRHVSVSRLRPVLLTGCATLLATGIAGFALVYSAGIPSRMPDFKQQRIAGTEDWGGTSCFNLDPAATIKWDSVNCLRARGSGGNVLIWGDSFAAHYMPGIVRGADIIGANVYQHSFAGCPPVLAYYSLARLGCTRSNARVPELVRTMGIDVVVLAARWTDTPSATIDQLSVTVAALQKAGARVIVVGQSPQFAGDIQKLDYLTGQVGKRSAAWRHTIPVPLNRQIAAAAGTAQFIDPVSILCRGDLCVYRNDNSFLYSDYGHFSRDGAINAFEHYLAPAIREELERSAAQALK